MQREEDQNGRKLHFLSREALQRIMGALSEKFPNMAKSVLNFFALVDSACARMAQSPLRFKAGQTPCLITVMGVEPIFRRISSGVLIGIEVFLGVSTELSEDPDQAGEVRILLGQGGDSEYTTFLYLDLGSEIVRTDRQITALTEALLVARQRLEREVKMSMRGASAERPARQQERGSGRRPASGQGEETAPRGEVQPPAQASRQAAQAAQKRPPAEQATGGRDPFAEAAEKNIPPLNIQSSEKINVPPELFRTKKKEEEG